MQEKRNKSLILLPLVLAIGLTGGIFIGQYLLRQRESVQEKKLATLLELIRSEYVDDINVDSLLEATLPELLAGLDPHSVYIPASELTASNEELQGSFSGVGVTFQILNDTVTIIEVVPGGPAEKVGLLAGDRIVRANDVELTGKDVTNDLVFKTLRGPKDTPVKLEIKRYNSGKTFSYDVTRGDIPVNSVDCVYMMDETTGYLKVSKFAATTYNEFLAALLRLKSQGATDFIVDLRGNSGGYMDQAIFMANEFLPAGETIVFTKGRQPHNETLAVSDGRGSFLEAGLAVITDEYSASASEIFAGAIQDNDRGTVIGRRTFGKGLVQNQIALPDSSAVRLTVARYYTPSGRSIQKEYTRGADGRYEMEIIDRYNHGEIYSADSVRLDKTKAYRTLGGRTVYGGGGIMPDIFVPEDTTSLNSYYVNLVNAGLIQKFAFELTDQYRDIFRGADSLDRLLRLIPRDDALIDKFVTFAVANGEKARWYYINQSRDRLLRQIKAMIVRDALGYDASMQFLNRDDAAIGKALELFLPDKNKQAP